MRGGSAIRLVVPCAVVFGAHWGLRSLRVEPMIHDDEFCHLAIAAFFAGLDWSPLVSGTSYYAYLYSAFVAPVFRLTSDPVALYRGALLLNSVFATAAVVIYAGIVRAVVGERTPCPRRLVALVIALYPSAVVYTAYAWAESLLAATYALSFLLFLHAIEREAPARRFALFGVSVGLLPMIHQRGLAPLLAACVTVGLLWATEHRRARQAVGFFAAVALMAVIDGSIRDALLEALWDGRSRNGQPLPAPGAWTGDLARRLVLTSGGQLFYLGASTAGLAFVGLAFTAASALRPPPSASSGSDERASPPGFRWGAVYAVATVLLMLAVSVLRLFRANGSHYYFYGRYNEAFLGPLLVYALLGASGRIPIARPARILAWLAPAAVVALAHGLVAVDSDGLLTRSGVTAMITGFFPYMEANWRFDPVRIGWIAAAVSASVLLTLRGSLRAGLVLAGLGCTVVILSNAVRQFVPTSTPSPDPAAVADRLRQAATPRDVAVRTISNRQNTVRAQKFQWRAPERRLVPIGASTTPADLSRSLVLTFDVPPAATDEHWRSIAFDETTPAYLWVLGGDLADRLEAGGERLIDAAARIEEEAHRRAHRHDCELELLEAPPPEVELDWNRWLGWRPIARPRIRIRNAGTITWWSPAFAVGVAWMPADRSGRRLFERRAPLPRPLGPGEQLELEVPLFGRSRIPPALPRGAYRVRLAMVEENRAWFCGRDGGFVELDLSVD